MRLAIGARRAEPNVGAGSGGTLPSRVRLAFPGMTDLDTRVHLLLRAGGHTVATAESLTGGRLAVHFTDTPGASETYLGGVVTYATELKASVLDVPA